MLGAIAGDIIGSRFEADNLKSKEFELFTKECGPTDDSNMTLAVAEAILRADGDWSKLAGYTIGCMKDFGKRYPYGYGGRFWEWLNSDDCQPYRSYGNGAAMRVSPCAWAAKSLEEAITLSDIVTGVTHNHPEGMKGARAITAAIWLARQGERKRTIRKHIQENYYPLDFTLYEIRDEYEFDVSCQGSVPQAIEAFLESTSFEDAIRNAVSIGGDSDTIAAMAGSIAEAYYGIPDYIRENAMQRLDEFQKRVMQEFEEKFGSKIETVGRFRLFSDDIAAIDIDGLDEINKVVAENLEKAFQEEYETADEENEVTKLKNICKVMFNRCRATGSMDGALCGWCGLKKECDEMHTI